MIQKITFSVYPSLQSAFKDACELQSISMSQQIAVLTQNYLDKKLSLSTLKESLTEFKSHSEKERKNFKSTIHLEADLYDNLKKKLEGVRPASFFCFILAHAVVSLPTQQAYAKKAQILLEASSSDITHVVYSLHYFKPTPDKKTVLVHSEFFLDSCTDERFETFYAQHHSPFLEVLAIHR